MKDDKPLVMRDGKTCAIDPKTTERSAILEILGSLAALCVRAFEKDDLMKEAAKDTRTHFKKLERFLRKEWGIVEGEALLDKPIAEAEATAAIVEAEIKKIETPAFLDALREIK